jgi:hypothetical protein
MMAILKYWYVGMSNIRFSSRVHIHDMVLKILDCALESAPPEDINEATQKVLDGRKANIEKMSGGWPWVWVFMGMGMGFYGFHGYKNP